MSNSHRGVKRSDSQGSRSHQHESSTVSPVTLKRYPSSDSLHSYSSAATLTAGSIYSAKSTPTLTGDTDSGSEIRDTGCSEDDNERMVTKKSSVYNYLQSKSDLCFAPVTTQPYWEKVENHEPVESHEAYVSHLRSSSYQLLQSRSQAQVSPLSESSSSNYYHVRQSSASSSHSQDEGIIPCRRNREKCCPPPSPSCLSPSQSSPPLPPQRDASSLRYINYGPGHEKYPSWPVPSPQNEEIQGAPPVKNNGGSFRSKSWTEQTDYPKERSPGYARPWKKAKQAPSYFQQLKTVVESGTERGSNSNNYYGAYLPPVDRDGKFYGDSDYNIPSPPERDPGSNSSCSYVSEEKRREPVTEETLALLAEKEGALSTPFLDQLRRERENCLVHQWSVNLKEDRDRDGRESVVTNSSNSSSNETLKCHGSLSDLSVCPCPTSIAHSARVPPPQRHQSECVLYYGAGAGIQNPSSTKTVHLGLSPIGESPPAVDVSAPPSVAQRIHDLERQSKSVPNLLGVKPDPSPVKPSLSNQRYKSAGERLKCYLSTVTTCKTEGKSYTYFDPEKKHKVSDPTLKAIQKQAVMQFFERQTGKQLGKNHLRAPRIQTLAREIKKTGSELEAEAEDEPNLRDVSNKRFSSFSGELGII
ncbi:unnamed protein product [Darwinula stevensoni]|uniref:Uncharacterized protein n=1 Tax=Darwinula stevensoni TaxID=69355 RepID=A0A7R8XL79_9CRUS|nr:unnamed protein product [Darwinula stevensoni]CAG0896068.1 unnamed protein product [Darwinula stevensoni]